PLSCPCSLLSFFLSGSRPPRHLHSFPTRRSSDLARRPAADHAMRGSVRLAVRRARDRCPRAARRPWMGGVQPWPSYRSRASIARSEEHTSELQPLAYLVCRLLLEKKKKNEK